MMLKKGPEIKMPNLKVPAFLEDLYYDLRERHLLPLVALLVLAIIAVPIALSTDSTANPSALGITGGPGIATPSEAEKEGKIVVAKSTPGLRDYQRRLKHLHPKDPFKTLNSSSGSGGGGGGTSTATAESASSAPTGESTSSESSGNPTLPDELTENGNAATEPGDGFKYYSYAVDVRVVPVSSSGKKSKAKPSVRRKLPNLTQLPSRKTPAVVFIGVSKDAKKAMMLISSNVTGAFGDGICVAGGSETCQLMALKPGVPETFVYGKQQTFRIEVLKIRLLATDQLNTAPLGNPKKKQKQSN